MQQFAEQWHWLSYETINSSVFDETLKDQFTAIDKYIRIAYILIIPINKH